MLKAIWMSDLHFTASGEVQGHDPKARLSAAVEHVAEHHPDNALTIISGDLVNHGTSEDYNALKPYLDRLPCPYYPMAGNHDDRALIKATFELPVDCMGDFIQYSVPTQAGLILCLDTQKTGSDAGEFCASRTEWLRSKLETAQNTPVFLFMHHPPIPLGLPMQDTDRLEGGEAILDLIAQYPNVKHLFIGHVHRPITGTIRGIPYATMRSVLYQAPAPKPDWNWESFAPAKEAPNLGVITLNNADVCLHYIQFCDYTVGTKTGL